jgi:hypothetical protein
MTKRRDIIKTIKQAAKDAKLTFELAHEGSNHTVYNLDGLTIPIDTAQREIIDRMSVVIYKECAAKLGKDWWK